MKRLLLALIVTCLVACSTSATGKILIINCNHTSTVDAAAHGVSRVAMLWVERLGINYEVTCSGDTTYLQSLKYGGSRYGRFDCALVLNTPNLYYWNTKAECDAINMPNFDDYISRSDPEAFPIPLIIPYYGSQYFSGTLAAAYTGAMGSLDITALSDYQSFKDAQDDSIYTTTPSDPYVVITPTTDSVSWVYPLMWRDVATRRALNNREAWAWMTKGTGNHRVVWINRAEANCMALVWPAVFGMFTKIQPVDMPVIAFHFGKTGGAEWGTSDEGKADTVLYGYNFDRIKDYAVANGIKIDLSGLMKSMKRGGVTINSTDVYTYATEHPHNIRITPCSYEGWYPSNYYEWIGSTQAASNSQRMKRIRYTQDSTGVFYPLADTTRADIYGGSFYAVTTADDIDSIYIALRSEGITDVYCDGNANEAMQPLGTGTTVGANRIWIDSLGTVLGELRFWPIPYYARYWLQPTDTSYADSLRVCYAKTSTYNARRAAAMQYLLPYCVGYYACVTGNAVAISLTTTVGRTVPRHSQYQPCFDLNALTFVGGSASVTYPTTPDSTQCLFYDMLAQVNNMVKMCNYIVATYGIKNQPAIVWSWMEDVKHDRLRGASIPNSHVRVQ